MSAQKFQSMNELSRMISEKIARLEEGKLLAEEISGLSNEIRELYDRIVVLQYKALEKGLKTNKETVPPVTFIKATEPIAEEAQVVKVETLNQVQIDSVVEKPVEIQPMKFTVSETPRVEMKPQEVIQPKTEPVVEPKPIQTSFFEPAAEIKEETANPTISNVPKASIAEKYSSEQKTSIAEKFAAEQKMTLADKLKMTRINDLRTSIGINQKFLFMNDLFEGENTVFNNAINRLNSCGNGDEAKTILFEYSLKYGWRNDSERVIQFFELIERRYL
jgi:anion-transporting  ArsA/GET3 family ATPase